MITCTWTVIAVISFFVLVFSLAIFSMMPHGQTSSSQMKKGTYDGAKLQDG